MGQVIFVASNNANFREMCFVAQKLRNDYAVQSHFIIENYSAVTLHEEIAKFDGINLTTQSTIFKVYEKLRKKLRKKIWHRISVRWREVLIKRKLLKRLNSCRTFVRNVDPMCVVVKGDRHLGDGWEPAMIKVCSEHNIPVVIINFAYTHFLDEFLHKRRGKEEFRADKYPDIMEKYPNQYRHDPISNTHLLYRKAEEIIAMDSVGVLPDNPWVMGGSGGDYILADLERTLKQYLNSGVPAKKAVLTGVGAVDAVYKIYRQRDKVRAELAEKYGVDPNKKLIIFSSSPLYEEKLMSLEEARAEFDALLSVFSEFGRQCLLSMHPRMSMDLYSDIIELNKIKVLDRPLSRVLPAADIFSASFSSTVDWALMCHIPTVIFDFYPSILSRFHNTAGVAIVDEKEHLENKIKELCDNIELYELTVHQMKEHSEYASIFDGRCLNRICDVITQKRKS